MSDASAIPEAPLVSIIIPARDSALTLPLCLESIARQTYPRVETIVVDNGSLDATPEIAAGLGAIVCISGGLRTAARNRGAREAIGEYLLHIDSDMELATETVAECVAAARRGDDLVILPERNVASGYWARAFSFSKLLYDGLPGFENARFVSRRAFDAISGYDETLELGEDADLHLRLLASGCRLGRINAVTQHHVGHLTLRSILRKSRSYDSTRARYVAKHGRVRPEGPSQMQVVLRSRSEIARHPFEAAGWFIVTALIVGQTTAWSVWIWLSSLARRYFEH